MSGWLIHSPIKYSVKLGPLRLLLSPNMQFNFRLTPTLINWISSKASATRITPVFYYLVVCQADACTHQLNIQWSFGHSDYSYVLVLGYMSGWCMHSPIEYSVNLLPLRLLLPSNMQFSLRRTDQLNMQSSFSHFNYCYLPMQFDLRLILTHTNWIFSEVLATRIIPVF